MIFSIWRKSFPQTTQIFIGCASEMEVLQRPLITFLLKSRNLPLMYCLVLVEPLGVMAALRRPVKLYKCFTDRNIDRSHLGKTWWTSLGPESYTLLRLENELCTLFYRLTYKCVCFCSNISFHSSHYVQIWKGILICLIINFLHIHGCELIHVCVIWS